MRVCHPAIGLRRAALASFCIAATLGVGTANAAHRGANVERYDEADSGWRLPKRVAQRCGATVWVAQIDER